MGNRQLDSAMRPLKMIEDAWEEDDQDAVQKAFDHLCAVKSECDALFGRTQDIRLEEAMSDVCKSIDEATTRLREEYFEDPEDTEDLEDENC